MEAVQKNLTIRPVAWSDQAARILARSIRRAPCFTVADYQAMIERDPGCKLYQVDADGELVGYLILRVDHQAGGAEGEILAAAGRLAGVDLTRQVLPAIERLFAGVKAFKISTARPGLVAKLQGLGWRPTHVTLRKAVA